jgi:ubiquinone/menaquinone biosynthesis C-methylase UbiE
MNPVDPFSVTDKLDEALLQVMVRRLEARGNHALFAKMLHEYLDTMNIGAAKAVLDMGCGTGVAARVIARWPGFVGRVTGTDLSPYLVAAAEHLAAAEGLSDRVTFFTGDTRRLDFPDETFDAVVAHTLVSHVEDPFAVVQEAARLVQPGGMVGIFDGDYASLTFGHADPQRGREYDEALIKAVVTNPRVMRQMPHLLRAARLELVAWFPYVVAEIGRADFWLSGIEVYRRLIAKAGVMAAEEADAWADSLVENSDDGVFFGASNYYGYVARKP